MAPMAFVESLNPNNRDMRLVLRKCGSRKQP